MVMDGLIRAHLRTASAFDALAVIDEGFLVLKGNGTLGANLATRMGQATLAGARHHAIDVILAGITGKLDNVDERWLIVRLGFCRLGHAIGELGGLVHALQRQAHGQADALAHDGALQKDALAVGRHVTRNDFVRQLIDPIVVVGIALAVVLGIRSSLVRQACHLGKNGTADLCEACVYPAHRIAHNRPPLERQADIYHCRVIS